MRFIRRLEDIGKRDVKIAGGKGASLGEMVNLGVPVPDGFVILANALDRVVEENDVKSDIISILEKVRHNDASSIEVASEKIVAIITSCRIPKDIRDEIEKSFKILASKFVAVRSSATSEDSASAAWAGQLETYLNVTENDIIEKVKSCWASLFTPRAIFYRAEKKLGGQDISVAVVVQKMVESDIAGVAFSVHPVTQDENQVLIEAGYGLGEAVVSAQITPDSYIIEKDTFRIIDRRINLQNKMLVRSRNGGNEWKRVLKPGKQKLRNDLVRKLAAMAVNIEKHYRCPCDIEWAVEGDRIYITQARPITTLASRDRVKQIRAADAKMLGKALSILHKQTWRWRWTGNWPLLDGIFQSDRRFTEKLMGIAGVTLGYSVDFYKGPILSTYYSLEDYERIHKAIKARFLRNSRYLSKCLSGFDGKVEKDVSALEDIAMRFNGIRNPTKNQLSKLFLESRKYYSYNAAMDMFCIYAEDALLPILKDRIGKKTKRHGKIEQHIARLTTPTKPSTFSAERKSFFEMSDKIRALNASRHALKKEKFLRQVKNDSYAGKLLRSHLKRFCWLPVLVNNPPMSFEALAEELYSYVKAPKKAYETEKAGLNRLFDGSSASAAERAIIKLGLDKNTITLIKGLQELAYVRTQTGAVLSKSTYLMRPLYTEIARRLGIGYCELKLLMPEDIVSSLGGKAKAVNLIGKYAPLMVHIAAKNARYLFSGNGAQKIRELMSALTSDTVEDTKGALSGSSANPGIVEGPVKIIMDSTKIGKIADGDILVAPSTSIDFVPAMRKAAAIITETGGITSHAAIVSRELNVPCIVGVKNATSRLTDGIMVEVDANNGIIRVLDKQNL